MTLLILLTIALIAVTLWYRAVRSRPLLGVVVLLALLTIGAATWNLIQQNRVPPDEHQLSVGGRLGQALAADLPAGGNVLVFQFPASVLPDRAYFKSQLQGLRDGLPGEKFKLVGLEEHLELTNDWSQLLKGHKMNSNLVGGYLKAHPNPVAIVSFVGLPECAPDDLPQPVPPWYVYGDRRADSSNQVWLASGLVKKFITE